MYSTLGTMNKLKRFLPQSILKLVYNSLVLPHLQYAILAWGLTHGRLFKLQKRAVGIISCSKYNVHTDPIFKNLNLLKLADIFKLNVSKFWYKLQHNCLPYYFNSVFELPDHDVHPYNTRHIYLSSVTRPKTTTGSKCQKL